MTQYTIYATAANPVGNIITVNSVDNMFSGLPIVFSGNTFGGITANATYYIGTVIPGYPTSTITLSSLPGGATYAVSNASGNMTAVFSSGGQQIINTVPPGESLTNAFTAVNVNFDQLFAAGPVNSNIQITNNTVLTTNTNGNLVLAPNGIGVVQSNVSIVPNTANIRNLGSLTQRWATVYSQYLNISGTVSLADLTVDGNLTVTGNTIQIGNITTETKTIQLANSASTANAANGSGITVGANDDIATLLYSSTSNTWTTNIGVSSVGNITAPYFFGNGSQLTGLPVQYGNSNVATLLAGFGSNPISTTGNISGGFIFGNISQANGFPATYGNANVANYLPTFSGNISAGNVSATGNIISNYFVGNGSQLTGISTANTGNVTFNDVNIIGTGNLNLQPNGASSEYLNIYLTGAADIHVAYGGGSGNVILGTDEEANIAILQGGNVAIQAGNVAGTKTWTFDTAGNLTLPRGGVVYETNIPDGGLNGNTIALAPSGGTNADQQLLIYPTTNDANHLHLTSGNLYSTELFLGDDNLFVKLANTGNVVINSNDSVGNSAQWIFGTDGSLTLPIGVSIDYNGNVQYPTIIADSGKLFSVQGQGNSGSAALAWTVDPNAAGQYAAVAVTRAGGDNLAKVVLQAQSDSGNVATAKTWKFNETGTLTLPLGGVVSEGASPSGLGNTIALTPAGGSDADQQLLIYPTGNVMEGNHLHLTTGNLLNTELYLGNDDFYVKLANTGNIIVNTAGNTAQWTFGTDGLLTFPTGNLVIIPDDPAGNIASIVSTDHPLGILSTGANGAVSSLWIEDFANVGTSNIAAVYANPTPGSGIVRIAVGQNGNTGPNLWDFDAVGNLSIPGNINFSGDACASPSLNDFFSVTSAANFSIITDSANSDQTWTFSTSGNLTAPGNISVVGNITGAYILGNGSQLTGLPATYGNANVVANLAALGSNPISTTGNITSGNISTGIITLTNGAVIRDTAGDAVAFGQGAGLTNQGLYAVAIGETAGNTSQGLYGVAVGQEAGSNIQGYGAVAVGSSAGYDTQGTQAVAIGIYAGYITQGANSVAVGYNAGHASQGINAVAIGYLAGNSSQGVYTVAIGNSAGQTSQGSESIAIGSTAGQTTQGAFSVAVGLNAGRTTQGSTAVALGYNAGLTSQGQSAVAIGYFAGYANQATNSIILNATGAQLNQTTANTFTVKPVRQANTANAMYYDASTGEITYDTTSYNAGTPAWTSAGAITFTATTTTPTKGTTTSDNISYRQLGAKQWEIILTYIQTVANGVNGSGDYLVTLPNSLSFDTTLPSQQITTTNIGTNTYALMSYIIPSGSGLINNDSLGGQVYPIVYDATKFRILTTTWGSAIQCWGSGYYSLGGDDPKIQLTFRFTST